MDGHRSGGSLRGSSANAAPPAEAGWPGIFQRMASHRSHRMGADGNGENATAPRTTVARRHQPHGRNPELDFPPRRRGRAAHRLA